MSDLPLKQLCTRPSAQCPSAQVHIQGQETLTCVLLLRRLCSFPLFRLISSSIQFLFTYARSFFDLFLVKEALSGVILTILIIFTIIIFTITILVLGMITVAGYAAAQESLRPFIARRTQPPYSNSNVRLSTSFISFYLCVEHCWKCCELAAGRKI